MLSLNWFKSRKQRELEDLRHEIKLKQLQKELERMDTPPPPPTPLWQTSTSNTPVIWGTTPSQPASYQIKMEDTKPYKTVKMVNDVLTVVLNDGSILSKPGATAQDFTAARNATDEVEILNIVATQEIVTERKKQEFEAEKARALKAGIKLLSNLHDFKVEGTSVYLRGINRTLPQLLVEEFLRIVNYYNVSGYRFQGDIETALSEDDEYQSLKRFFMWCCLNPRAEVADKLYNFLKKNSFKITKQGFFAALRNVVTLHGSTELVQFVSNAYNKVKAVWKKSPDNYHVILNNGEYRLIHEDDMVKTIVEECDLCEGEGEYRDFGTDDWEECGNCGTDGEYEVTVKNYEGEDLGRLTDLYLDLPNRVENRFTDDYTRTFDIRVGRPVNMDPAGCRWNTDDCGAEGLHFTSNEIHYVGCGDQSVLVLINPMKVVGIGESKGRCWEYLPIMTVPREEATSILHDLDFDTLQLDDSYAVRELEGLTEKAKDGFVAESKKHEFNMPHISTKEIENIVASLDDMKYEIRKRIVSLD
jgi:hypothetical protein